MAKVITNNSSRKTASSGQRALTESQSREVEKLAYQFFLDRGGEHGHDQEDWARAESIVRSGRN